MRQMSIDLKRTFPDMSGFSETIFSSQILLSFQINNDMIYIKLLIEDFKTLQQRNNKEPKTGSQEDPHVPDQKSPAACR